MSLSEELSEESAGSASEGRPTSPRAAPVGKDDEMFRGGSVSWGKIAACRFCGNTFAKNSVFKPGSHFSPFENRFLSRNQERNMENTKNIDRN